MGICPPMSFKNTLTQTHMHTPATLPLLKKMPPHSHLAIFSLTIFTCGTYMLDHPLP